MSQKGLGQRAMEWPPLVRIYESRLWRRSPLFALGTGISFEDELDLIAGAAQLDKAERVLDLACGPGIYSRPFARRLSQGRLIGLDLSAPMLGAAQRVARDQGLANLTWVRGSALELPFPAESFDAVNCCAALHLFPDPDRALREMHRVLRPGGRLTLAVVRRDGELLGQLGAALSRILIAVDSFTRDELESRTQAAGFENFACLHEARLWLLAAARKAGKAGTLV